MVVVNDIADGLEARLATIDGLHTSSEWIKAPRTPQAVLYPPQIQQTTFDDRYDLVFDLLVFVSMSQGPGKAARQLNQYMDTAGSTSIMAAIESDTTLGGVAEDVELTGAFWDGREGGAGFITINGVEYWGAFLRQITVYVSD